MATTTASAPTTRSSPEESVKIPQPAIARNIAVDAYRGFVMFLMMAEVLRFATRGRELSGQLVLERSRVSPDALGMDRLFAARHDSALVLFSGRRGAALLHRQPHGQGRNVRQDVPARALAIASCWSRWASSCAPWATR